jgi:dimethylamine monooxygenase subunit C
MQERNHSHLAEQLQTPSFELNCLEHPLFEQLPNYRKVLFLIDELDLFDSLASIDLLSQNKIETSIYVKTDRQQGEILNHIQHITHNNINYVSSFENDEVETLLSEQMIGTRIFISGPWEMIQQIKEIAGTVGFTDEEIHYNGSGETNDKVYCVKCYSYNKSQNTNEITCEHCNTVLDVSKHFSKRLDAHLGYIQVK